MISVTELKILHLSHKMGLHKESSVCIANHGDLPLDLIELLYSPHRKFARFAIPHASLVLLSPNGAVEEICDVSSAPLIMTTLLLGNNLTIFCRVKEQFAWSPRIAKKWGEKLARAFKIPVVSVEILEEGDSPWEKA